MSLGIGIGLRIKAGGDGYGPELFTLLNAASLINEANAITGFSEEGLNGAGANEFISQGVEVYNKSYALKTDANDTPTGNCRIYIDLQAAPFNFVNGEEGRIIFYSRHIGSGSTWKAGFGSNSLGLITELMDIYSANVTWLKYNHDWVHDGNFRYLIYREASAQNNGGIYLDAISIRKKL